MPAEIDFSEGVRGKFYKPDLRLIPPVRLESQDANTTKGGTEIVKAGRSKKA